MYIKREKERERKRERERERERERGGDEISYGSYFCIFNTHLFRKKNLIHIKQKHSK